MSIDTGSFVGVRPAPAVPPRGAPTPPPGQPADSPLPAVQAGSGRSGIPVEPAGLLRDGTAVGMRPLVPADRAWFAEWVARLSEGSRCLRFLHHLDRLSPSMLDRLVDDVDGRRHVALVAVVPGAAGAPTLPFWTDPTVMPVAVGRFIREQEDATDAEVAYAVANAWQGRGVGGLLLDSLVTRALALGVNRFTATVRADNHGSLRLLRQAGRVHVQWGDEGDLDVEVALALPPGLAAADSRSLPASIQANAVAAPTIVPASHGR
jgi:GNAT superfamily N-acetyltransferase